MWFSEHFGQTQTGFQMFEIGEQIRFKIMKLVFRKVYTKHHTLQIMSLSSHSKVFLIFLYLDTVIHQWCHAAPQNRWTHMEATSKKVSDTWLTKRVSFSYTILISFIYQNNIYKTIKHITVITVDMKVFSSDVSNLSLNYACFHWLTQCQRAN